MADDGGNQPRRFDWKQAGIGGGFVAALFMIAPVKEFFFTREEGNELKAAVLEIKQTIIAESRENTRVMERKVDHLVELVKEKNIETRHDVDRDNDVQNERISNLETAVLKTVKRTN